MKIFSVILIVILFSGCSFAKPNVQIVNSLRELTDEEFGDISIKDSENINKNDLKCYELKVESKNLSNVETREVNVPDMKYITKAILEHNKDAWAIGNSTSQNNNSEDHFLYQYKVLLNMKNISFQELKDILDKFIVDIYISDKNGNEISKKWSLGSTLTAP